MTAPLSQRLRCLITGHDWRRAIGPRHGYYLRCRRCWITGEEEAEAEITVTQVVQGDVSAARLQRQA